MQMVFTFGDDRQCGRGGWGASILIIHTSITVALLSYTSMKCDVRYESDEVRGPNPISAKPPGIHSEYTHCGQ